MDKFIEFIIFFSGTSIGGVLGYLLKTQIDHKLAISRNYEVITINEFNKAAATFRAAFVDAIYALRRSEQYSMSNGHKLLRHGVQFSEFQRHESEGLSFY